jgi:hypothetical protein
MLGGKVVAHVNEIHLKDVEFRVRENGRQKVLREGKKNVHAFVIGTVIEQPENNDFPFEVTYNPYKNKSFMMEDYDGLWAIKKEAYVHLRNNKVYV